MITNELKAVLNKGKIMSVIQINRLRTCDHAWRVKLALTRERDPQQQHLYNIVYRFLVKFFNVN